MACQKEVREGGEHLEKLFALPEIEEVIWCAEAQACKIVKYVRKQVSACVSVMNMGDFRCLHTCVIAYLHTRTRADVQAELTRVCVHASRSC